MTSSLDKMRVFKPDDVEKFTDAKENMKTYMKCFSQTFELPTVYIQDQ